jgi:uncharacterized protein (DUF362 family)
MLCDVFLARVRDYSQPDLADVVGRLLESCGCKPAPGTPVLVKPNLVAPYNSSLSCTNPLVVRAACAYLLDHGAKVSVGDSPAFGTARIVAKVCGLTKALRPLPVKVIDFSGTKRIPLSLGGRAGVAPQALEAELILNIPRFKAHDQMLLSLAMKNFFGCVTGLRKTLAHQIHGERANRFESMIMDVALSLPKNLSLMDGVVAMHGHGPARGAPYPLGLIGAAASPVALDTAMCMLLGLDPAAVPLGREALSRGLAGAKPQDLAFPLETPEAFPGQDFILPGKLANVAFGPSRVVLGRLKSLYVKIFGTKGTQAG